MGNVKTFDLQKGYGFSKLICLNGAIAMRFVSESEKDAFGQVALLAQR